MSLKKILEEIKGSYICKARLPLGPNPALAVITAATSALNLNCAVPVFPGMMLAVDYYENGCRWMMQHFIMRKKCH